MTRWLSFLSCRKIRPKHGDSPLTLFPLDDCQDDQKHHPVPDPINRSVIQCSKWIWMQQLSLTRSLEKLKAFTNQLRRDKTEEELYARGKYYRLKHYCERKRMNYKIRWRSTLTFVMLNFEALLFGPGRLGQSGQTTFAQAENAGALTEQSVVSLHVITSLDWILIFRYFSWLICYLTDGLRSSLLCHSGEFPSLQNLAYLGKLWFSNCILKHGLRKMLWLARPVSSA